MSFGNDDDKTPSKDKESISFEIKKAKKKEDTGVITQNRKGKNQLRNKEGQFRKPLDPGSQPVKTKTESKFIISKSKEYEQGNLNFKAGIEVDASKASAKLDTEYKLVKTKIGIFDIAFTLARAQANLNISKTGFATGAEISGPMVSASSSIGTCFSGDKVVGKAEVNFGLGFGRGFSYGWTNTKNNKKSGTISIMQGTGIRKGLKLGVDIIENAPECNKEAIGFKIGPEFNVNEQYSEVQEAMKSPFDAEQKLTINLPQRRDATPAIPLRKYDSSSVNSDIVKNLEQLGLEHDEALNVLNAVVNKQSYDIAVMNHHMEEVVSWLKEDKNTRQAQLEFQNISSSLDFCAQLGVMTKCKELQQAAVISKALYTGYTAVSQLASLASNISAGAIAGPVGMLGGAALSLFSLFMNDSGSNATEIIIDQINKMGEQIIKIMGGYFEKTFKNQEIILKTIVEGFQSLSQQLNDKTTGTRIELSSAINMVQESVNFLMKYSDIKDQKSFIKGLDTVCANADNWLLGNPDGLPEQRIPKMANKLANWATTHASNEILSGAAFWKTWVAKKEIHILKAFINLSSTEEMYNFFIAFLANYAQQVSIEAPLNPLKPMVDWDIDKLVNPFIWSKAVDKYLALKLNFPQYDNDPEHNQLKQLMTKGQQALNFLRCIEEDINLWDGLLADYYGTLESIKKCINGLAHYNIVKNMKVKEGQDIVRLDIFKSPKEQLDLLKEKLKEKKSLQLPDLLNMTRKALEYQARFLPEYRERFMPDHYIFIGFRQSYCNYLKPVVEMLLTKDTDGQAQAYIEEYKKLLEKLDITVAFIKIYAHLIGKDIKKAFFLSLVDSSTIEKDLMEYRLKVKDRHQYIFMPCVQNALDPQNKIDYQKITTAPSVTHFSPIHPKQLLQRNLAKFEMYKRIKYLAEPEPNELASGKLIDGRILYAFRLEHHSANCIHLAGTFNNWLNPNNGYIEDQHANWQMAKKENDVWEVSILLNPGSYEFKYVIDLGKEWENHSTDDHFIFTNESGNSVLNTGLIFPTNDRDDKPKIAQSQSQQSLAFLNNTSNETHSVGQQENPDAQERAIIAKMNNACKNGNLPVLKSLLATGISVNARNQDGQTLLSSALDHKQKEIVNYLLLRSADHAHVYSQAQLDKKLVNLLKQSNFSYEEFELYLLKEANVNLGDETGNKPLHYAAMGNHVLAIIRLVEFGADINSTNSRGQTPLHLAMLEQMFDAAMMLLNYGADSQIEDSDKQTPFDILINSGFENLFQKYLDEFQTNSFDSNRNIPIESYPSQRFHQKQLFKQLMQMSLWDDEKILEATLQQSFLESGSNAKQALTTEAAQYGFRCVDVKPDGNCFFHAVLHQFQQMNLAELKSLTMGKIKERAINYILDHEEHYSAFMGESSENFIDRLLKGGWADYIFIHATAKAFNVTIAIIESNGLDPVIMNKGPTQATLYLGHEILAGAGLHYQSLIKNSQLNAAKSIEAEIKKAVDDNFASLKNEKKEAATAPVPHLPFLQAANNHQKAKEPAASNEA